MTSSIQFVDVFELRELDMVPGKDGKVKDKKFDKGRFCFWCCWCYRVNGYLSGELELTEAVSNFLTVVVGNCV